MKVAIISGITGQDGALLAELLTKKDYRVIGLMGDGRPSEMFRLEFLGIREKIELKKVNLLNDQWIKAIIEENQPDEFYHLAAISSVGFSFKQPLSTFDFNTRSVMYILEALRQVSPQTRFYQASSSEMFGSVGVSRLPIKESFLFHPVSPYGISKASAHWLTVNYREAYRLHACCGILFNHESALRPPTFVIKKIIETAVRIKAGERIPLLLGNMNVTRDWGYAPLYVDAMWRMLQREVLGDYLICSGLPMSLNDFVKRVFNSLDLDEKDHVKNDPSLLRSLDLDIIYGDNKKAKEELNWEYSLTENDLVQRLIADEVGFQTWQMRKVETL